MKYVLLAAATLVAAAALGPSEAEAQSRSDHGFSVSSSVSDVRFGARDRDHRRDRRRNRDFDGDVFIGEWPDQGDTVWRPESFNDWWHDSPSRAFPRWVQNGDCDRLWWSGGGWRC